MWLPNHISFPEKCQLPWCNLIIQYAADLYHPLVHQCVSINKICLRLLPCILLVCWIAICVSYKSDYTATAIQITQRCDHWIPRLAAHVDIGHKKLKITHCVLLFIPIPVPKILYYNTKIVPTGMYAALYSDIEFDVTELHGADAVSSSQSPSVLITQCLFYDRNR